MNNAGSRGCRGSREAPRKTKLVSTVHRHQQWLRCLVLFQAVALGLRSVTNSTTASIYGLWIEATLDAVQCGAWTCFAIRLILHWIVQQHPASTLFGYSCWKEATKIPTSASTSTVKNGCQRLRRCGSWRTQSDGNERSCCHRRKQVQGPSPVESYNLLTTAQRWIVSTVKLAHDLSRSVRGWLLESRYFSQSGRPRFQTGPDDFFDDEAEPLLTQEAVSLEMGSWRPIPSQIQHDTKRQSDRIPSTPRAPLQSFMVDRGGETVGLIALGRSNGAEDKDL